MSDPFHARNYYEAAKRTDGASAPGNVIRSILHIGYNLWQIVDAPAPLNSAVDTYERGVTMSERWNNICENWGLK